MGNVVCLNEINNKVNNYQTRNILAFQIIIIIIKKKLRKKIKKPNNTRQESLHWSKGLKLVSDDSSMGLKLGRNNYL